jgi:putative ABC transport system substrate-binding protein
MRRREFITLVAGAAATSLWPLGTRAQQSTSPAIGFITSRAAGADSHLLEAFREGLKEMGYEEGRNVTIEFRFAENRYSRLPGLAADLARRQVAVIYANGVSVAPAMAATTAIPIVFTTGGDPVRLGFVASLQRPGGNVTGVTTLNIGNAVKRLGLLHEVAPQAVTVGFLHNPDSPLTNLPDVEEAARAAAIELVVLGARDGRDLEEALETLVQRKAGALLVGADPFFVGRRQQLVTFAAKAAIPAMYFGREFVEAGGLMSYAARLSDAYRDAGIYVGQVLKGKKPSEMPVRQATSFELLINIKTAKALGLTVPPALLANADEFIE